MVNSGAGHISTGRYQGSGEVVLEALNNRHLDQSYFQPFESYTLFLAPSLFCWIERFPRSLEHLVEQAKKRIFCDLNQTRDLSSRSLRLQAYSGDGSAQQIAVELDV